METTELRQVIEAMIFVSEEPLTENAILLALAEGGVSRDEVRGCLEEIERDWNEDAARGIGIVRVAGGLQFRTKPACSEWLRKLNVPKPMRLSGPALETLAIIAYRQPILRSEIEKIRGVDTGGVLKTLLERRLLRIVGRSQEPGQPLLYGTTQEFLEVFNLNTLSELPTLKDIDDLMRERRAMAATGTAQARGGDEEELTELIEDEEDATEVIRRRPLDEDEEEEGKDMEALHELESQIGDLRRLERHIFPKEKTEMVLAEAGRPEVNADETTDARSADGEASGAAAAGEGEAGDAPAADGDPKLHAPAEDDRPFE